MCPHRDEISGEMNSKAVGLGGGKGVDSYPSFRSSDRHCGNPSCPVQQYG